ncbi:hypothetical protein NKH77_01095 [Streptomyces sp. M19]
MSRVYRVRGPLERRPWRALADVAARHAVLRSRVVDRDGRRNSSSIPLRPTGPSRRPT